MVCPPLCGAVYMGHLQYPAFACSNSEVAVRFLVFLYLVLSLICPNCACMLLFLVPHSFFVSVA